jgi:prevent-host-death family protein
MVRMFALKDDFTPIREASNRLSKLVDRARQAPQVITRSGRPAAVIVDPGLYDEMQRALSLEAESLRILADAAAARADRGAGLSAETVRAHLTAWRTTHGLPAGDPPPGDPAEYLDLADAPDR